MGTTPLRSVCPAAGRPVDRAAGRRRTGPCLDTTSPGTTMEGVATGRLKHHTRHTGHTCSCRCAAATAAATTSRAPARRRARAASARVAPVVTTSSTTTTIAVANHVAPQGFDRHRSGEVAAARRRCQARTGRRPGAPGAGPAPTRQPLRAPGSSARPSAARSCRGASPRRRADPATTVRARRRRGRGSIRRRPRPPPPSARGAARGRPRGHGGRRPSRP